RHFGKHDIQEDDVDGLPLKLHQCLGSGFRYDDVEPFLGELIREGFAVGFFVLHHENSSHALALSSARGIRNVKVDPSPALDHTVTFPPWLAATCLTILNPSPVPPVLRERA